MDKKEKFRERVFAIAKKYGKGAELVWRNCYPEYKEPSEKEPGYAHLTITNFEEDAFMRDEIAAAFDEIYNG